MGSETLIPRILLIPPFAKKREGWERVPREEQMFLPAVAAWGTRSFVILEREKDLDSRRRCLVEASVFCKIR